MESRDGLIQRITDTQRRLGEQLAGIRAHPLLDVHVTMAQLKVLLMLARSEGIAGQDLALAAQVSLATMSGIVDRLVAQDLVTRSEDPHDRRIRRLTLTEAGRELTHGVISAGEQHQQRLLKSLDAEELTIVAAAFDLLLKAAGASRI